MCGNDGCTGADVGWVQPGAYCLRPAPKRRTRSRCRRWEKQGWFSHAQAVQRVVALSVKHEDGDVPVASELELLLPPKRMDSNIFSLDETELSRDGDRENGLLQKASERGKDHETENGGSNGSVDGDSKGPSAGEVLAGGIRLSGEVGSSESVSFAEKIRQQGKIAAKQGEYAVARELFSKCVEVDPCLGKGWQNLARVNRKLGGSIAESLAILKEGITHDPNNSYLWLTCGVLEQERGDSDMARTMFKKGVQHDSSQVAVYVSWARMEAIEGNYEMARKLYIEGTVQDPNCERLYHSWAIMETRLRNTKRAIWLFEKGLEIDPTNPYLWHGLGRIAVEEFDYERAKYCFEQALVEDGNNTVVLHSLGYMELYRLKNYTRARELFDRALSVDPENLKVLVLYSKLEMHESNFTQAASFAERAVHVAPQDASALVQLAMVHSNLHHYTKARRLFKRAIDCESRNMNREAYYHWGTMEWRAGNRELSSQLLQRCRSASDYEDLLSAPRDPSERQGRATVAETEVDAEDEEDVDEETNVVDIFDESDQVDMQLDDDEQDGEDLQRNTVGREGLVDEEESLLSDDVEKLFPEEDKVTDFFGEADAEREEIPDINDSGLDIQDDRAYREEIQRIAD